MWITVVGRSRNQEEEREWITNTTNGRNHTNEHPFSFHSRESGNPFYDKDLRRYALKITTEIKENAME